MHVARALIAALVVALVVACGSTPAADPLASDGDATALLRRDPRAAWLAGRALFNRQFSQAEGAGEPAAPARFADRSPVMAMGLATSCALCHNVPFGDAGGGATIARNGASGRSTPHLFGAGLLVQLGERLSQAMLAIADADGDGVITAVEAAGHTARVASDSSATAIDFGRFDDRDGDGRPDLDPALRVWYVDAQGRRLPAARRLGDPGVAGYRLALGVFGWSAADGLDQRSGASLRAFIVAAFAAHAGVQADDPRLAESSDHTGFTKAAPTGSRPPFAGTAPDPGRLRDEGGRSLDDPDRDGVAAELGVGEIDLIESYLFNHPQPVERASMPGSAAGRERFQTLGCAGCHTPTWHLPGAGDRRQVAGRSTPMEDGAGLIVAGIYSDLRHHDLGAGFHQWQFDGSLITRFRTPPLWGVGTTAPYGHDGASLDLDAVIRRHGGEGAAVTARYAALDDGEREQVLAFLRGLVLTPVVVDP